MLKYAYKSDWGFTLIELLVAVLIISLFAGLAAPRLNTHGIMLKNQPVKLT